MERYPDPPCPLDHSSPFQLLVCVILSAQVCVARFCCSVLVWWYFCVCGIVFKVVSPCSRPGLSSAVNSSS